MNKQRALHKTGKISASFSMAGGISFTFLIAFIGFMIIHIPGLHFIGQLAASILIAILYRQFFGYPEKIRSGISFSSQKILRLAIILYGLKLNIAIMLDDGLGMLLKSMIVIIFAIVVTVWLAKKIKANPAISLLLGVGTGICGAAAIAAIAPIIKSDDEDTAISVGIIALVGTIFALGYTLLAPILPLTSAQYGAWSGLSLHEIAQVVLAAAAGGDDALTIGLLAKLSRVFLLIPVCFIAIFLVNRKQNRKEKATNIPLPWFLLGFIAMSLLGSFVFHFSDQTLARVSSLTTWLLTAAMVGLGLNVNIRDLRKKALKPLLAMVIVSVLLSVLTFWMVF